MKISSDHHSAANDLIKNGKPMKEVRELLMAQGLSKSQAHDVARIQRKKLGLYKPKSGWQYQ